MLTYESCKARNIENISTMLLTNVNFISLSILLVVPYPYYSFKYRSDTWIRKATTDYTVSSLFSTWKENDSSSPPLLSLEDAANRLKVIQFGQKPNQMNGLETSDRSFYLANKAIEVNRVDGSLGINLIEVYSNDDNISGLVLISDASTSDQLMVGDSIIKLSNGERSIDVTGLNYDNTINAFRQFSDDNKVTLTVQRLQRRKEINVKIVGPNNEFVKEFTVISGYGANLRTALQSNNLKMYDERTSRFDSPYQTGDTSEAFVPFVLLPRCW